MKWWIAVIVVLIDQLSKLIVRSHLSIGEKIGDLFFLTHIRNTGIGFGLLQNLNLIWLVITVIVVGMVIYYREEWNNFPKEIGAMLVLGGGVGNGLDRIFFGSVIDFIGVGWWPVFNIADSAVVIGAFVLGIWYWRND